MSGFVERVRFRLDHQWAPSHMSAYLDAELRSSGRGRFERHLTQCDECRRLLAGLRGIVDALGRLPTPGQEVDAVQIAASVRARLAERPGSWPEP